jgi:hypothetical protein
MNSVKRKDRRLTNFKGADWIEVLLQKFWPDNVIVGGIESDDELSAEDSDNFAPCQPSPMVTIDTLPTVCGSDDRINQEQRQTTSKPSTPQSKGNQGSSGPIPMAPTQRITRA